MEDLREHGPASRQHLQDVQPRYGRWYSRKGNEPRDRYLFPVDEEERNRLDIFHKFFLVARQNLLFSSPVNLKHPRILDLGTGTGIWAIEVTQAHPHAFVLGVDINMIQPRMIPSTMEPPQELDIEGLWKNIADDWDLIHVRALFGSVQSWDGLYRKAYRHLKPGSGYIEQVEIDWLPRRENGECIDGGAIHEWTKKLLLATDKHGCPMRVDRKRTQRQLKLAGFESVSESTIDVCYNPWSKNQHEREVARWFNLGLSHALTALSYKPMIEHLNMLKSDVDQLCHHVFQEICSPQSQFHCKVYLNFGWSV